jgi:cyclopropane-fatty-acyl-phospholipid synthase
MNTHTSLRARQLIDGRRSVRSRAVASVLHLILDRIDRGMAHGALEIILPDGSCRVVGGRAAGPHAHLTVSRWRGLLRMAWGGSEGCYLGWDKREWDSPDLVTLFELFMANRKGLGTVARPWGVKRLALRISHWLRRNTRQGASRNILAHYDLGNDFYRLWLDKTMTYSSALFVEPITGDEPLEVAQACKVSALLALLDLKPKSHLLEVGSGWGYLSRRAAQAGHRVTALTISPAQKLFAQEAAAGLPSPPDYRLIDYRDVVGQFDAIISVEMVEAVGQQWWPAFLDMLVRCLKPGGQAALQYIAIDDDVFDAYAASADFIQTHIFPGGMLISQSRFQALAEARGLKWETGRSFGLHYAETLRRWREQFDTVVDAGTLPAGFDERFVRMWRYYLMYCEGGFRSGGITVAQAILTKSSIGTAP